jgi:quercetin dioxygenase-like cupin family protein
MDSNKRFYFGNAKADEVRGSGWFVGQFVPAELGLRRQTEVELKWGIHPDGEKRSHPWANQNGTTISVLIEGSLRVTFHVGGIQEEVMLQTKGDYVVFGPEVVHTWEAVGDAIVLSVRFPSVEVGSRATAIAQAREPTREDTDT